MPDIAIAYGGCGDLLLLRNASTRHLPGREELTCLFRFFQRITLPDFATTTEAWVRQFRSRKSSRSLRARGWLCLAILVASIASIAGTGGPAAAVRGGTVVDALTYPYMAQLMFAEPKKNAYAVFCNGTLIDPSWILTAGHCVHGSLRDPEDLYIHLAGTPVMRANKVYVEPGWSVPKGGAKDNGPYLNDIGLIHLSKPDTVDPVVHLTRVSDAGLWDPCGTTRTGLGCGNPNVVPNGSKTVEVLGFGCTLKSETACAAELADGDEGRTLREASLNVLSYEALQRAYAGHAVDKKYISAKGYDSMIVGAGVGDGSRDSCDYDSGGPLLNSAGREVALTSWSSGCGQVPPNGVYAQVGPGPGRSWIDEMIPSLSRASVPDRIPEPAFHTRVTTVKAGQHFEYGFAGPAGVHSLGSAPQLVCSGDGCEAGANGAASGYPSGSSFGIEMYAHNLKTGTYCFSSEPNQAIVDPISSNTWLIHWDCGDAARDYTDLATEVSTEPLGAHLAKAVSTGTGGACALTISGGVQCWGDNSNGELGNGDATGPEICGTGGNAAACSTIPVDVSGLTSGVSAISVGDEFACALTTNGGVKCWGVNAEGELGDGTSNGPDSCFVDIPCSTTPVDVTGLTSGVKAISAGEGAACAVTTAGTVKCWGKNLSGALGTESDVGPQTCSSGLYCSTTPVAVAGLAHIKSVAMANPVACALTTAGAVKCWGDNAYGELGTGHASGPQLCRASSPCSTRPVAVQGLSADVKAISAGYYSYGYASPICAITTKGGVKCWGANDAGELGHGSTTGPKTCTVEATPCSPLPLYVTGITSGASAVSAGWQTACALLTKGTVKCWGANNGKSAPTGVHDLGTDISAVSTGAGDTCALTTAGVVECWGGNYEGDLGDGTTTSSATPVAVSGY